MFLCLGLILYLFVRDAAIAFSDRVKSGVVGEQLWLQITEPTEKDRGKYGIEFHDGKGNLMRTVELSGQGESEEILLFQQTHKNQRAFRITSPHVIPYSVSYNLVFIFSAYDDAYAEFQRLK